MVIGEGGKFDVCYTVSAYDVTNHESAQSWPRCKPLGSISKELVDLELIPSIYAIGAAYPNPFNPVTSIQLGLPEDSKIELVVFDLAGRVVRNLVSGKMAAGYQQVDWDGTDDQSLQVSSGVYIYLLTAVSLESEKLFTKSGKMVLLR